VDPPLGATEIVSALSETIAPAPWLVWRRSMAERLRTVPFPAFSLESVRRLQRAHSGEIGLFLIESERGVASGVRRIDALPAL